MSQRNKFAPGRCANRTLAYEGLKRPQNVQDNFRGFFGEVRKN